MESRDRLTRNNAGNRLFPIFLKMDQIQTLIIGGGNIGLEKLNAVLKNDPHARVHLVAGKVKKEVWNKAANATNVNITERSFHRRDLKNVDLVILATNDNELHKKVKKQARKKHLLLNVADTPDLCDFYLGSTVKKGNLKIGISTNGQSPTFAKRLREVLEEALPEETDDLLTNLKKIRDQLTGNFQQKIKKLNEVTSLLKI